MPQIIEFDLDESIMKNKSENTNIYFINILEVIT